MMTRSVAFPAALAVLVAALFAVGVARAAPINVVEIVNVDLKEKERELHVRVRSSLREMTVATEAKPTMAPFFAKPELEEACAKYGNYVLPHTQLLARTTPVTGKLVDAKLVGSIEGPVHQTNDLDKYHCEAHLLYPVESNEPLTLSFDLLNDKPDYAVGYSVDIRALRMSHSDLTTGGKVTFDVADNAVVAQNTPGLKSTNTPIRTRSRGSSLAGAFLIIAICGVIYWVWQRRRRGV
jgi:hypothetical protein